MIMVTYMSDLSIYIYIDAAKKTTLEWKKWGEFESDFV